MFTDGQSYRVLLFTGGRWEVRRLSWSWGPGNAFSIALLRGWKRQPLPCRRKKPVRFGAAAVRPLPGPGLPRVPRAATVLLPICLQQHPPNLGSIPLLLGPCVSSLTPAPPLLPVCCRAVSVSGVLGTPALPRMPLSPSVIGV